MDIESLTQLASRFPLVTQDIKWEHHLAFCIGGKMFLILSLNDDPVSASFKCTPELFEELTEHPQCIPAPYMARNKWITVNDISAFDKSTWMNYLTISFDLISGKLPVAMRKKIAALRF